MDALLIWAHWNVEKKNLTTDRGLNDTVPGDKAFKVGLEDKILAAPTDTNTVLKKVPQKYGFIRTGEVNCWGWF